MGGVCFLSSVGLSSAATIDSTVVVLVESVCLACAVRVLVDGVGNEGLLTAERRVSDGAAEGSEGAAIIATFQVKVAG